MQHVNYPLPPLFLTEIIEKCQEDHAYHHYEDDSEELRKFRNRIAADMVPVVREILAGYGRHECDEVCRIREKERKVSCLKSCDDSDWIVTLQYSTKGYCATYGIKRAGDVQDVQLWCN